MKFAKSHEWIRVEGEPAVGAVATIGVSAYAVEALTDLVFMQLPAVGTQVTAGESFGEIESVKAVSDLYCPVSGTVVKVHDELIDAPETVNQDPYEEGWMIRVEPSEPSEVDALMNADAYDKFVDEES